VKTVEGNPPPQKERKKVQTVFKFKITDKGKHTG